MAGVGKKIWCWKINQLHFVDDDFLSDMNVEVDLHVNDGSHQKN